MDVLFSLLPIVFLIAMMTRKRSIPSYIALPAAALVMYFFRLTYFETDPILVHAGVIQGFLTAWTPILVIWGAVFLFALMKQSHALETIHKWLEGIAENKVEQIMIVGWAFSFFIEGASGFGTPVALAAPILVGFGFAPVRVVMLCLVMNTIPVSFGAVGTPTWFGLGNLGLSELEILTIGQQTALIHTVAGLVIPFLALRFLVTGKEIWKNKFFILLSVLSCTIPYLLLSQIGSEFPALVGGAIGLGITAFLSRYNIGVEQKTPRKVPHVRFGKLMKSFFPLLGVIVLLVLTRVESFEIKELLTHTGFKTFWGEFWMSSSFVVGWDGILGTNLNWSHAILYVPSFLPFLLVGALSFYVLSIKKSVQRKIISTSFEQMKKPTLALVGILIFVKLMMVGEGSPAMILGEFFAGVAGGMWPAFAPLLGALGAFFSGSNTVSNLTFGGVQMTAAQTLGLPRDIILSFQNVGGAMGNMVSIQNIVAGCSVLGLVRREGEILLQTIKPLLWYAVIAGVMGLLLT